MITVSSVKDNTKDEFLQLFEMYYTELDCDEDAAHIAEEYVLPDVLSGLLSVDLIRDGETFVGFAIYQTDDVKSDFCLKEGWGDIREIFILPEYRRQGLGKFLLYTAEMKLRESGAEKSFTLPTPAAEEFFVSCGYVKTDEHNAELDCYVFEKHDLTNKCK